MTIKNPAQLEKLKAGGRILALTLDAVKQAVKPGVSAAVLNEIAEKVIVDNGARPAFKNYSARPGETPFPAGLCVSVNDEVVHGIPSADKILEVGDIVSIDVGVEFKGLFTDAAMTVPVGKISKDAAALIDATQLALDETLSRVKPGATTGDLGFATEQAAKRLGFNVVRELVGHGVGLSVHEDPEIPCFGKQGTGTMLKEGMVLAIEPMLTAGNWKVGIDEDDHWTVFTADGSLSAHFEHTVVVTANGCEILTNLD